MPNPVERQTRVVDINVRTAVLALLIGIITFITFLPSLDNDFNYDDDNNILSNYHYRGFSAENLKWMFTTFHMGHYQPLTWLSLAVDYKLWGMNPRGYHTTNLFMHCLNAILVFLIARILLSAASGHDRREFGVLAAAGIAALVFALHPLRTESVAWITERRDVLSSCFLLASLWVYLTSQASLAAGSRKRWLCMAFLLYVLSLLSRAMGVTFPIILLVLDWYPLGRFRWGRDPNGGGTAITFAEKLPYFAVAGIMGIVAIQAQQDVGASIDLVHLGGAERIAVACYGLFFYLYKTFWPLNLAPFYELKLPVDLASAKYILSGIGVVVTAGAVIFERKRCPSAFVAAICYTVILLPVLGLFQSGRQEVADRYSYLPSVVLAILIGGALLFFLSRPKLISLSVAILICVMITCAWWATLTWGQCKVWRDRVTLWTHGTKVVPESYLAYYNLGCALGLAGEHAESIPAFRRCLEINKDYTKALFNMGNSFQVLGRNAEALETYARAIAANPADALSYFEQGNVFLKVGRSEDARSSFKKVTELRNDYPKANVNLGVILAQKGDHAGAMEQFRYAIRIAPDMRDAHYNLAISLEAVGKPEEAMSEYREAIRIDPGFPDARVNLGNTLARKGRIAEAVEQYQAALKIDPAHRAARVNLDRLMANQSAPQ